VQQLFAGDLEAVEPLSFQQSLTVFGYGAP
jgi:hypothetical protein